MKSETSDGVAEEFVDAVRMPPGTEIIQSQCNRVTNKAKRGRKAAIHDGKVQPTESSTEQSKELILPSGAEAMKTDLISEKDNKADNSKTKTRRNIGKRLGTGADNKTGQPNPPTEIKCESGYREAFEPKDAEDEAERDTMMTSVPKRLKTLPLKVAAVDTPMNIAKNEPQVGVKRTRNRKTRVLPRTSSNAAVAGAVKVDQSPVGALPVCQLESVTEREIQITNRKRKSTRNREAKKPRTAEDANEAASLKLQGGSREQACLKTEIANIEQLTASAKREMANIEQLSASSHREMSEKPRMEEGQLSRELLIIQRSVENLKPRPRKIPFDSLPVRFGLGISGWLPSPEQSQSESPHGLIDEADQYGSSQGRGLAAIELKEERKEAISALKCVDKNLVPVQPHNASDTGSDTGLMEEERKGAISALKCVNKGLVLLQPQIASDAGFMEEKLVLKERNLNQAGAGTTKGRAQVKKQASGSRDSKATEDQEINLKLQESSVHPEQESCVPRSSHRRAKTAPTPRQLPTRRSSRRT